MERDTLAASPTPFTIDGQDYLMSPIRDCDLGMLDRWVKKKILETAELSDDEFTRRAAVEVASVATWAGKYGAALSRTPEGVARYMHVGIVRNHPAVQLQTVIAWVKDDMKRQELHRAFDVANDIVELEKKEKKSDPTKSESTAPNSTPT